MEVEAWVVLQQTSKNVFKADVSNKIQDTSSSSTGDFGQLTLKLQCTLSSGITRAKHQSPSEGGISM